MAPKKEEYASGHTPPPIVEDWGFDVRPHIINYRIH
jgi:hypothetical protein